MNEGHIESSQTLSSSSPELKPKRRGHTKNTRHGQARPGSVTLEYDCWCEMKKRCNQTGRKDSANYIERGITVCERWQKFENFFADMGPKPSPKHSLDRQDNDGNYCPENCRWATKKEQCRNTRRNRWLTFEGKTHCLLDWAILKNMPRGALTIRLKRGWSVEKALTYPLREHRSRPVT